jgi:transposase
LSASTLRAVVRRSWMDGVVLAGPERHRRFSDAQKIAIVGESFLPGVRVREIMDRYGLASSVIYTWRKQAREGHFGGGMFAPVAVVDQQDIAPEVAELGQIEPEAAGQPPSNDGAAMVVALPDGVRILVNNSVDEGALGKVLRALAQVPAQRHVR